MKFNLISSGRDSTVLIFSASSFTFSMVSMISGIAILRWISPKEIGYWNSLIILQSFSIIMQFGIFNGLNRELPYLQGKGQNELALRYVRSSQFLAFVLAVATLLIGVVVIIYMLIMNTQIILLFTTIVIIISIAFNFMQNYLQVTFRSNQSFLKLAIIYFIQSIILVLSLAMVFWWGYNGFLWRQLLTILSLLIMSFLLRPIKTRSEFSKKDLFALFKIGFPFFSMAYLQSITASFTRLAILHFSSVLFVGLFSPALAVISAMMTIPTTIAQFLSPKMSYKFGQTGVKSDLWLYVKKSTLYIVLALLPIVVIGYFALPYLINILFPNYSEGIFAAQLVLISGIFNGITIANNSLISIRANKPFLFLTLYKLVTYTIFIYYFAYSSDNILNGAATGYFLAEVSFGVMSLLVCYKILKKND